MAFPRTSLRALLGIALSLALLALLIPAPGAAQPAHHKGKGRGTTASGRSKATTKGQGKHSTTTSHPKVSSTTTDAATTGTGPVTNPSEATAETTAAAAQAEPTGVWPAVTDSGAADAAAPTAVSVDGGDPRGDASTVQADTSPTPA